MIVRTRYWVSRVRVKNLLHPLLIITVVALLYFPRILTTTMVALLHFPGILIELISMIAKEAIATTRARFDEF